MQKIVPVVSPSIQTHEVHVPKKIFEKKPENILAKVKVPSIKGGFFLYLSPIPWDNEGFGFHPLRVLGIATDFDGNSALEFETIPKTSNFILSTDYSNKFKITHWTKKNDK